MAENNSNEHNFQHLVKTAYALADSLACTHEIEEISFLQKDMSLEEWIDAMRHLLAQIDTELVHICGIPVFRLGLHPTLSAAVYNPASENIAIEIPRGIYEATSTFGQAFNQVMNDFLQSHQEGAATPTNNAKLPNEIIDLTQQMVDLILSDLGFKSKDFDKIY